MMLKNKKYIFILLGVLALLILVSILIFVRRDEDTWVQDKSGKWVKHGNPSAPNPAAIVDFDTCAKYYPIIEANPEQCETPEGQTFTKGDVLGTY